MPTLNAIEDEAETLLFTVKTSFFVYARILLTTSDSMY